MTVRDDAPVSVGGGGDEPVELGDRRPKHVSVTMTSGERIEHGDVYVRHSATAFAVATDPSFPDDDTTRYDKSAIRRVEVTQHHSACFITTATAGEGSDLDVLRGFRDDVLVRSPIGRPLLRIYDAVSPPVARTLSRHPRGRSARFVRWLVARCAGLERWRSTRTGLVRPGISVALTLAYTVGLAAAVAGHALIRLWEMWGAILAYRGDKQPVETEPDR